MAFTVAGGGNTFVPSHQGSNFLVVAFSRSPDSFPLANYVDYRGVKKTTGYYLEFKNEEAGRVFNPDDFLFADGADLPDNNTDLEGFEFKGFDCKRHAFTFKIGNLALQQGEWPVLEQHLRFESQKAMTSRVMRANTLLENTASWGTGNYGTATSLGGGKWDVATASAGEKYILQTFNAVKEKVFRETQGAVGPNDLRCTVSPTLAHAMRESLEITDFIKQHEGAPAIMEGREFFDKWGVPKKLYGVEMVVEDTTRTSTRKKTTAGTKAYLRDQTKAVFTSQVNRTKPEGELPPGENMPNASTVSLFLYEDMSVATFEDTINERKLCRIIDNYDVKMTAPASGMLVTGAMAAP